jgi:uncharacterized repeat protein (TIGR01451 family)
MKPTVIATCLLTASIVLCCSAFGQSDLNELKRAIARSTQANGLTIEELTSARLERSVPNRKTGHIYHYFQQTIDGIPVYNAIMTVVASADGELVHFNDTFVRGASRYQPNSSASITVETALKSAIKILGLSGEAPPIQQAAHGPHGKGQFERGTLSQLPIDFSLVFHPVDAQLILTWELVIKTNDTRHWWQIFINASDGSLVTKNDWITTCRWDAAPLHDHSALCETERIGRNPLLHAKPEAATVAPLASGSSYRVYAEPLRSPYDGSRTLRSEPWTANTAASPFGWHDTDGAPGAEFTITRGNNVWAQEDRDGNDGTGFSPDGGPSLTFDYPLDLSQQPVTYQEAAITNLFYWNNLLHDILYNYGFDEASGNFQQNNYGNGGLGNDFVFADAQDGSFVNNATFGTPPDGQNPRMQMFEWTIPEASTFIANGTSYGAVGASFGQLSGSVNAELALYLDGSGGTSLACDPPQNAGELNGRIALIDRGTCTFVTKVLNAQNAGAVAAVVVQNSNDPPFSMGGSDPAITIPSVMISLADGVALKSELNQGTVNVSFNLPANVNRDSDLDNEIIAHEYAHGLSTRLTAGADNVSCLFNNEQMGEGWSDYLGLITTMNPGDNANDARGIANYSFGDGPGGNGIRPFPYSYDLSVNPVTYDYVSFLSIPHGVGSVWCSMLWDMTWLLIDEYGYDPDLYNGTGGNNVALQLVVEGMKLQPCSPGFVDGRDAILLADELLYNGANQCIIWEAFARRGLGAGADQGSSASVSDGTESYEPGGPCSLSIEKIADAVIAAGSTVEVTLIITNNTGESVTNAVVTDLIPTEVSYVAGSASCNGSFNAGTLTLNLGDLSADQVVVCTYELEAPEAPFTEALFFDDIEGSLDAYSIQAGVGSVNWTTTQTRSASPVTSWFAQNPDVETDFYLLLPAMSDLAPDLFMSFRHFYSTEATWDGCVVEYSTDGGASWLDAGPLMTLNGYNGTINVNQSSAISGRPAFTGASSGFIQTLIDLNSLAGQTVQFRFRLASDFIIGGDGWYVDDIFIGESLIEFTNVACVTSDQTGTLCSSVRTRINAPEVCLGDFDNNGLINATDLLMLLAEFGCNTNCLTDMTGSGTVGAEDMLLFLPLFSSTCGD